MDLLLSELNKNTNSIYTIVLIGLSILIFWANKFHIYRKSADSINLLRLKTIGIVILLSFMFFFSIHFYTFLKIKDIITNLKEETATVIDSGKSSKSSRTVSFVFSPRQRQILSHEPSENAQIGQKYKVYYSELNPQNCKIDLSQTIGFDSVIYKRVVLGIVVRK